MHAAFTKEFNAAVLQANKRAECEAEKWNITRLLAQLVVACLTTLNCIKMEALQEMTWCRLAKDLFKCVGQGWKCRVRYNSVCGHFFLSTFIWASKFLRLFFPFFLWMSLDKTVWLWLLCPSFKRGAKKEVIGWNAILDGTWAHLKTALWARGEILLLPSCPVNVHVVSKHFVCPLFAPYLTVVSWFNGWWCF